MINIILFEDDRYACFYPFSTLHPLFDLKSGLFSIVRRAAVYFPEGNFSLLCRDYLAPITREKYPKLPVNSDALGVSAIMMNSNFIMNPFIRDFVLDHIDEEFVLYYQQKPVVSRLEGKHLDYFTEHIRTFSNHSELLTYAVTEKVRCIELTSSQVLSIQFVWDMIAHNEQILAQDIAVMGTAGIIRGEIDSLASLTNDDAVFIDKGSRIEPFVYIDASHGPVYIGKNVTIGSHTRIEGPAYIGDHTVIYQGNIRPGCSIGPRCKLGGEVAHSIFMGYSNKTHEGFVGHTYVGEWVNFGALTTTSNLKNNYSSIRISQQGKLIETQQAFLGSLIGDYCKFAIGCMLNTGSVFGIGCNVLVGGAKLPKELCAFSWLTDEKTIAYQFDRFIATAEFVSKRRGEELSHVKADLLSLLFRQTWDTRSLPE